MSTTTAVKIILSQNDNDEYARQGNVTAVFVWCSSQEHQSQLDIAAGEFS